MKLSFLLTAILTLSALTTATVNAAPKPEQPQFLVRCDNCNKEQKLTPTLVLFNGGYTGMQDGVLGNTAQTTLTFKCKCCKKHTFTAYHNFFVPAVRTMQIENRKVPVPSKAVPVNSAATNSAALMTLAPKPPKIHTVTAGERTGNPGFASRQ